MKMISKVFLVALGAAALFAAPAKAATLSLGPLDPIVVGTPVADATTAGLVQEGVTGQVIDAYFGRKSPWASTSNPGNSYTAIFGGPLHGNVTGTATYNIASSAISLLWGTVDDYNAVYFMSGNSIIDTVTGGDVISFFGLTPGASDVNLMIQAVGNFDSIVFASTGNAFEYANISVTAVPLPAALPLYGAGIAVLGFVGWRKRKKANAA